MMSSNRLQDRTEFLALIAGIFLLGTGAAPAAGGADDGLPLEVPDRPGAPLVYVIPIKDGPKQGGGMIDYWLASYVKRQVDAARSEGAALIIFEIDTYGGSVDAAIDLGRYIDQAAPIPTVAYVTNKAWSGGAYVALTCDRIFMETGSTMGSAQVVTQSQEGTKALGEKYTSAVRAKFRARAEKKERHKPYYALYMAMVDPKLKVIEIRYTENGESRTEFRLSTEWEADGATTRRRRNQVTREIVGEGTLLNVTAEQAFKLGMTDGVLRNRDELIQQLDLAGGVPEVRVLVPSLSEEASRFFAGSVPSGILILIGTVALLIELKGAGGGIGALVFAFCMGLFFWCKFVAGHAGGLEILLFLLGAILLVVEVFVIPGFGVFGFTGIGMLLGSLVLSFVPPGYILPLNPDLLPQRWDVIHEAFLSVFAALGSSLIVIVVVGRYMHTMPILGGVVLQATMATQARDPEQMAAAGELVGKTGVAVTALRPAGKAEFSGSPVSVVSQNEYIERGEPVRVLDVAGGRVVVERAPREA